ncbi:unnamed protein product [Rotaria magnacalcarata]|uniref:Uncharacterized protein n=1 Tax=Rotaria magnacalcarata TaxID=392030 RepID=A0A819FKA1_9BILA|nr:unnamed protein product [Rotaria magnacalcarata]CAF3870197.1 unnamed protein product [Rotaria magnacalcarata]
MTSDISADFNSFSNVENQTITNNLRLETTDFSKYLRNIAGIHVSYLPVAVICTGLDLIFTLITLVMGSTNMSECPIEPLIPIYLVVISTINLVMIILTTIAIILHMRKIDEDILAFFYVNSSAIVILILQLFSFIWLIFGSVWTFDIYNDVQYSQINQNNYCKSSLYKYTIVSIVLQYIIPFVLCGARNASSIRRKIH